MSDLIAEIHPRAAAKVEAFAKVLWDHGAQFVAEWEHKQVALREPADVQRVLEALKAEIVRDDSVDQNVNIGYTATGIGEITILDAKKCGLYPLQNERVVADAA